MLIDAIRGELFRFWHNSTAVFWGLIFIPLSGLVTGIFWRAFLDDQLGKVRDNLPEALSIGPTTLNLSNKLLEKAATLADPTLMAFFLVAAATIFATDYRWETWRLIRPRNSRHNLLLGKVITVALLAAGLAVAVIALEALGQIVSALIEGTRIELGFDIKAAGTGLVMMMVGWIRLCQFALLALIAAVVTRSLAASIIVPIVIAAGAFMLYRMSGIMGWQSSDWSTLLTFPGVGYDTLQAGLMGARAESPIVLRAITGIALWVSVPLGVALWLFDQQDLPKE